MKLFFLLPSLLVFTLSLGVFASETPTDSVGIEKKGTKTLLLYKISAGESLFSIARKYKTSVSEIMAENDMAPDDKLKADQIIKVPYSTPPPPNKNNNLTGKIHTVKTGEGLYGIARQYKIKVEELKKWNNLVSETIKEGMLLQVSNPAKSEKKDKEKNETQAKENVSTDPKANTEGQKIHIVKAGEGLFKISQLHKISVANLRKWNNLDNDDISIGQELILEKPTKKTETLAVIKETEKPKEIVKQTEKIKETEKPKEPATNYNIPVSSPGEKTLETGMAEAIDDGQSNDAFLALHRTAPVGMIVQIRNLSNDMTVFVKVVGKLPDTGANDKLIVKISKKAYDRLAAIDRRFRVETSYFPQ
jgi:LysM repeat protein